MYTYNSGRYRYLTIRKGKDCKKFGYVLCPNSLDLINCAQLRPQ